MRLSNRPDEAVYRGTKEGWIKLTPKEMRLLEKRYARATQVAHEIINRHIDHIGKLWAISIPTVALAIAGFGWKVAEDPGIRRLLAIAGASFALFFLLMELHLWRYAAFHYERFAEDDEEIQRQFRFRSRPLRWAIVAKFLMLVGLTLGIYFALPSPSDSGGAKPAAESPR